GCGHAVDAAMQVEVLAGGQLVVERGVLEDEADAPANRSRILRDVDAGDARLPGGRPQQRAEDADGGRLPRAIRPEEAEDLALVDRKVDAANRFELAVLLDEARDLDDRRHFPYTATGSVSLRRPSSARPRSGTSCRKIEMTAAMPATTAAYRKMSCVAAASAPRIASSTRPNTGWSCGGSAA